MIPIRGIDATRKRAQTFGLILTVAVAMNSFVAAQTPTLTVADIESDRVSLLWNANPSAGSTYRLQKKVGDAATAWTQVAEIREHRPDPPSEYRRKVEGLKANAEHCFRVVQPKASSREECIVTGGSAVSAVQLGLRIGPFSQQGTKPCTGNATWRFTPERLTGTGGKSATFTIIREYEVNAVKSGANWYCTFRDNTTVGLRGGHWKIEALTPVWKTTCVVSLHGGNNNANFAVREAGCKEDATFPG